MDVDVLLWGGTHRFEAYELEGKFFVNPGSATGAVGMGWGWEKDGEEPVPSFVLMDVSFSALGGEGGWCGSGRGVCGEGLLMCVVCGVDSGRCVGAVCLSAQDGCQWRGECGG